MEQRPQGRQVLLEKRENRRTLLPQHLAKLKERRAIMAQRGSRRNGRKQNRNTGRRRPRAAHCQMCKRPSRGRLRKWTSLMVCGRCYKTLSSKFISGKNARKKVLKSLPPQRPKGFWELLFGR